ncbi:hypothetical protein [Enterococcus sp. C76]|uniref:hypothetical protein n=1 Tax=Enterococcus TaxID=1350 RepID=UPI0034A05B39
MKWYKPCEACEKIGIPKRTLYRWIRKIEERTRYRFSRRIDEKKPWYINGVPRKQIFLDDEDISFLSCLRLDFIEKELPLDYAIDKNFMLAEEFEQLYPAELRINRESDVS